MYYAALFAYDIQSSKAYLISLPHKTLDEAMDDVVEIGRSEKYQGKIVESLGILGDDGEVLYTYRNREFVEGLVRE